MHRAPTLTLAVLIGLLTLPLILIVGEDFFPSVDAGLMKLHFRAPSRTRIEETEEIVLAAEEQVRQIIPPEELDASNDMIGIPIYINLPYVPTENVSGIGAEIRIALKPKHRPTLEYMREIRRALRHDCPGCRFWFQPADIVTQIPNFGLATPIDVQVQGMDFNETYPLARRLRDDLARIPGVADVYIAQVLNYPTIKVDVDRVRAANFGLSQRDVANTLLISLSSNSLISPSFFSTLLTT